MWGQEQNNVTKWMNQLDDKICALNFSVGSNVATMIDEMEYTGCNVAAKSVDLDEVDKESIHLLVFLFMQFLSCSDQVRLYIVLN